MCWQGRTILSRKASIKAYLFSLVFSRSICFSIFFWSKAGKTGFSRPFSSFLIAVTLFQSLGKANKATWLVLFRQIILFIPLCIVLPMVGGMGIRGVWLAIALTDAILVVITVLMMLSEFPLMPEIADDSE